MTWRDRGLALVSRGVVKQVLRLPLPWSIHRQAFRLTAPTLPLPGVDYGSEDIAGVPCEVVTPPNPEGTLLWLHGGGFVLGSARSYSGMAAALARLSGYRIVLPNYRLAPEHPYPAAPDDCLAVARRLAVDGPFALGGDSAGGCLAVVTLADLLRDGTAPTCMILASPAGDLDPARAVPTASNELLFPLSVLYRVVAAYVGTADPRDPRVSPVHGEYAGGPPTLFQCAKGELLETDTDALADRLRAGGARVEVEKTEGVPHVWQLFAGRTPKADRAIARMADFLRAHP
ncbi:alpha/beta hydrolase [Jannaschia donghaensis]|uniref:Putative acetyl-hydrolase LipR n=1 Tax=Jannaschia donghaensis TaxID=420998 RepID=A0A0M6YKH7_9RHOB|nr:alpha/beta hydrolase [Jannaschia donghaensis]CTQ50404.1 Putative acetyl-hydrolase LipR precursor [Jannaschia donghaensis]